MTATTVSELVTEIIEGGGFDASSTTVLRWLDRRHKEMVNFARAYRDLLALATTVAGQAEYAVPAGIVELQEITVDGETYVRGNHTDIAAIDKGFLWLSGPGGLVIESTNASNATTIVLKPTPTTAGLAILGYGAVQPPDLELDNSPGLLIDEDLLEALKSGVYAIGLGAPSQGQADEAAAQLALYADGKQDFKRRTDRRLRGSGPTRMRIAGRDA